MRLPILATILALMPLPALADVTARYAMGKDVLVVEVDDGGNSRIGVEGKFGILRRDGVDYIMMQGADGSIRVAELAELLDISNAAARSAKPRDGAKKMPDMKFLLTAKGEELVGGRKGSLWSFGPEFEMHGKPGKQLEVVVSNDPALAPIATLFRHLVELLQPLLSGFESESSDFFVKARDLSSKGAPLRIDKLLELQSTDAAEIDAKRFELPAPVISAEEWMNTAMPGREQQVDIQPLP